jgi:hypothetical protein
VSGLVLLAHAIEAEREADAILAAMAVARDRDGSQALVPSGWHERAQQASDLRRRARWLRGQAAGVDYQVTPTGAVAAPGRSPSLLPAFPATASAIRQTADPVEALAAQIIAAASAARGR